MYVETYFVVCDVQCTSASGCSVQGAGKCDSDCESGHTLDDDTLGGTYTCDPGG